MAIQSLNEDLEGSETTLNCLETMVLYIAIESTYSEKFMSVIKKIEKSVVKIFTSKSIRLQKRQFRIRSIRDRSLRKRAVSEIGHFEIDHLVKNAIT